MDRIYFHDTHMSSTVVRMSRELARSRFWFFKTKILLFDGFWKFFVLFRTWKVVSRVVILGITELINLCVKPLIGIFTQNSYPLCVCCFWFGAERIHLSASIRYSIFFGFWGRTPRGTHSAEPPFTYSKLKAILSIVFLFRPIHSRALSFSFFVISYSYLLPTHYLWIRSD